MLRIAVVSFLVLAASATAAVKPKPWMWTPAQAARALVVVPGQPNIDGNPYTTLTKATCRGQGKAVARRYVAFRCVATFEGRAIAGKPAVTEQRVISGKVRKVGTGQLCIGTPTIPSGCLATSGSTRVAGDAETAGMALRRWLPAKIGGDPRLAQGKFFCLGHGAGYYVCTFESNRNGSVAVTLTTRGPRFSGLTFTT